MIRNLELRFNDKQFSLTDEETKQVILTAKTNQANTLRTTDGLWNISIYTQDQLNDVYLH